MHLVCLDLEGVLVPEIWINFAKETKIKELELTTRDISDYDVLMKKRIDILRENQLTFPAIQDVISRMEPLAGAKEFLREVREKTQLIILSDTFEIFASPLMKKLEYPTIFCNTLVVNERDEIASYVLRQQDGKRKAVKAFQSIGYKVLAAGDSYNDLTMLQTAERGLFFRAPQNIIDENPEIKPLTDFSELLEEVNSFIEES